MILKASIVLLTLVNAILLRRFFPIRKSSLLDFFVQFVAVNFLSIWIVYRVAGQIKAYQQNPNFFSVWSWLNWSLVLILFALFLVSYLIRKAPIARAKAPREIFLPLICSLLPFVINDSILWRFHPFIIGNILLKEWFQPFYVQTPGQWNAFSIVLILIGNVMTLAALFSLKNSFSILSEVRVVVTDGIYRYLRHPMYVGEILATVGILFLSPSKLNIFLTLLLIAGQCFRAKVEEEKLIAHDQKYQSYQEEVWRGLP